MVQTMINSQEGMEQTLQYIKDNIANWRVMLWKNVGFTPDVDTVLADLVEADWAGYLRQTPTWGAITFVGGQATMSAVMLTWNGPTTGAGNVITGYSLIDQVEGVTLANSLLPAPQSMAVSGDTLTVQLADYQYQG